MREQAEGHRRRAPPASGPSGAGRRRQPRQVDRGAVGRGNQIHVYDAGSGDLHPQPGRSAAEPARQEAGQGGPPVARRVAGLQPRRQVPRQRQLPGSRSSGTRRPGSSRAARSPASPTASWPWPSRPTASCWPPAAARRPRTARSRSSTSPPASSSPTSRTATATRSSASASAPTARCWPPAAPTSSSRSSRCPRGKFVKSFEGHTHHVLDVGWKSRRQAARQRRRRQRRQGLGLREGRAGPHHQRPRQAGHAAALRRQDAAVRHLQRRPVRCDSGTSTTAATCATSRGSTDFLYAVGVSPDGTVVAAGGEEGVVRALQRHQRPAARNRCCRRMRSKRGRKSSVLIQRSNVQHYRQVERSNVERRSRHPSSFSFFLPSVGRNYNLRDGSPARGGAVPIPKFLAGRTLDGTPCAAKAAADAAWLTFCCMLDADTSDTRS